MARDDRAIVIGISRYPRLGDQGTPLNVGSADADVDLVTAWLTDPAGGDVPAANVRRIVSSDYNSPADVNRPFAPDLEEAMLELVNEAEQRIGEGKGARLGRRLYVYMSGHGFSPRQRLGCLYAANAHPNSPFHIHATSWLNNFQDAGYFSELVLWLDCCMNRVALTELADTTLRPLNSGAPAGQSFVAFAAQRPLKAAEIETAQSPGNRHGAFTWALVEGLRGAAANESGYVTGRSLADWLRNSQGAFLSEGDRKDVEVSKRPQIVQEDQLTFGRGVPAREYQVTLKFPAAAHGQTIALWGGYPVTKTSTKKKASQNGTQISLPAGLYVAEAGDYRQGFEVVRPCQVDVSQFKPEAAPASNKRLFDVKIPVADPATEVIVIDRQFALVDSTIGAVGMRLPAGVYKVIRRLWRNESAEVVLVDRDGKVTTLDAPAAPRTVSPLPGTGAIHEYHVSGADQARQEAGQLVLGPNEAALTIVARVWTAEGQTTPLEAPWAGIKILDAAGQIVMDLSELKATGGDPIKWRSRKVAPGIYYLRQRSAELGSIEQSLHLCPGWRLEVSLLWEAATGASGLPARPRIGLSMWRDHYDNENRKLAEIARTALADENPILTDDLARLLFAKWEDPIAGLIGAHLLIVDHERDSGRDLSTLNVVVENLRGILGPNHPDLAALSLYCTDPKLRSSGLIPGPPMFARSWPLLLAQNARPMVPPEVWARAAGRLSTGPYLIWTAEDDARERLFENLDRAISRTIPIRADFDLSATPTSQLDLSSMTSWRSGPTEALSSAMVVAEDLPVAAREYLSRRRKPL